ncbi:MAG: DUF3822 family protein [Muribaculaceae bacterium]|nr:DUF3822 family protein [Muribaculaceae bacterium]
MDVYTPARSVDFTDTGLWRLVIYISRKGMTSLLRHIEDASQPLVRLFSVSWDVDDARLLSKIESTIYDNPRVLEDYATDIIVESRYVTWVPSRLVQEEEIEEEVFTSVFPTLSDTPMTDTAGDLTALFSLTAGLSAFIGRTIPGARVRSHLTVLADYLRNITGDSPAVYADIRENEVDILLFHNRKMLAAVTHDFSAVSDIGYRIFQLLDTYNVNPAEATVSLSGKEENVSELSAILSPYCREVGMTPLPVDSADNIPAAAAIAAG